jgi:hypothetical protein
MVDTDSVEMVALEAERLLVMIDDALMTGNVADG